MKAVGRKESVKSKGLIGILEVFVHQARDIHNICIYQKQDVYAKLYLTSDPETTVSTQIINGGGKNPVFNENLKLNVGTIDSSLKCEIWMLSRVRNYLEDQLLGFTLVSLSDVLMENGKLAREFSLSSSDLFHSPAGFVQLAITYAGASPEVMELPTPHSCLGAHVAGDSEVPDSLPCELDKIEFPDPKVVNENEMMVSEYFGIPCANLDSQTSESFGIDEKDNRLGSDTGVCVVESWATDCQDTSAVSNVETPPSSISTSESTISVASKSPNQDAVLSLKAKIENGSSAVPVSTFGQHVIGPSVEPEQKMVQQEIVDMYMKSMQQFTEALAKMKLPMDIGNGSGIENESGNPGNPGSDGKPKPQSAKSNGQSPRVFYGSRAFF